MRKFPRLPWTDGQAEERLAVDHGGSRQRLSPIIQASRDKLAASITRDVVSGEFCPASYLLDPTFQLWAESQQIENSVAILSFLSSLFNGTCPASQNGYDIARRYCQSSLFGPGTV
jgi:hypothetical protein